jgi:hypothetical protein
MLILGTILIIGSFALITLFPTFMSFFPSERLAGWFWTILIMSFLALGLFSIFIVKTKEAIVALLFLFTWSLVFFVPVPQGYEEPIYGGLGILLTIMILLFDKYRKSRKNGSNVGKREEIKCLDLSETAKWFLKCSWAVAVICLISGLMAVTFFGLSHPQLLFTPMPILALAITFMTFIVVLVGAKRYEALFKALQILEFLYRNKEKTYTTEMINTELKIDEEKLKKALNMLQKEKMVEIHGNNIQLTELGKITVENSWKG